MHAWWNDSAKGMSYKSPREHLFEQLGLPRNAQAGLHAVGKGFVIYEKSSPAGLAHRTDGADQVRSLVRRACPAAGLSYQETNYLVLRRGRYVVAAGLDESPANDPRVLRGHFVNLFDARLPVVDSVTVSPGTRHLLVELDRGKLAGPAVVASACKVLGAETTPTGSFRFYAEGPEKVEAAVRLALAAEPVDLTLDGKAMPGTAQDLGCQVQDPVTSLPKLGVGEMDRDSQDQSDHDPVERTVSAIKPLVTAWARTASANSPRRRYAQA